MKTIKLAALSFTFVAAAVLLGGCVLGESTEGDEVLDAQSETEEETAEAASALSTKRCITGACAIWESSGDHLYVTDTAPDGRGAVGQLRQWTAWGWAYYTCYNYAGDGTTRDCSYAFQEGLVIYFRTCKGEGGGVLESTCNDWYRVST
jgi:hypothetical protein